MTYVRSTLQQRFDMVHERQLELQIEGACHMVACPSYITNVASWREALTGYAARAMSVGTLCHARAWQASGQGKDNIASAWRERAHRFERMAVYAYDILAVTP